MNHYVTYRNIWTRTHKHYVLINTLYREILLNTSSQSQGTFFHLVHFLTQFDLSILREQDILAFNVTVDDFVLVKMSQTLQHRHREHHYPKSNPILTFPLQRDV